MLWRFSLQEALSSQGLGDQREGLEVAWRLGAEEGCSWLAGAAASEGCHDASVEVLGERQAAAAEPHGSRGEDQLPGECQWEPRHPGRSMSPSPPLASDPSALWAELDREQLAGEGGMESGPIPQSR